MYYLVKWKITDNNREQPLQTPDLGIMSMAIVPTTYLRVPDSMETHATQVWKVYTKLTPQVGFQQQGC